MHTKIFHNKFSANQEQIIINQCTANVVGTTRPNSNGVSAEDKVYFLALFKDNETLESFETFDERLKNEKDLQVKLVSKI